MDDIIMPSHPHMDVNLEITKIHKHSSPIAIIDDDTNEIDELSVCSPVKIKRINGHIAVSSLSTLSASLLEYTAHDMIVDVRNAIDHDKHTLSIPKLLELLNTFIIRSFYYSYDDENGNLVESKVAISNVIIAFRIAVSKKVDDPKIKVYPCTDVVPAILSGNYTIESFITEINLDKGFVKLFNILAVHKPEKFDARYVTSKPVSFAKFDELQLLYERMFHAEQRIYSNI